MHVQLFQHKLISMHVQLCVSGLIVLIEHYIIVLHSVLNIHYAVAHHIKKVKRGKDALRMRAYTKRIQEDKTILEDFMAFVAEQDLELFLEFHAKRAMESQEKSTIVYEFDTSLLE